MCKRPLEMVVYDPDVANKRPRSSADTGALVPYDVAPIHAVPLNAVAFRRLREVPPPEEPPACVRSHILPALRLRADLPVHYIDRKRVVDTDLSGQQNRFRIPSLGAASRLRLILTPEEVRAANIHDPPPQRPRRKPQAAAEAQPENLNVGNEAELPEKKKKKQGKVHGGLPVRLVDVAAGASGELLLAQWESSRGTIIKGPGYLSFIQQCSFKESDVVEIWAFKQRAFRLFGTPVYEESPLHVLIVKRDDPQQQCRYCPHA